jgi:GNAT superfamily N-acetyltransferase
MQQVLDRAPPDAPAAGPATAAARHATDGPCGLAARLLAGADAGALHDLRRQVVGGLRDPDFYVLEDEAFVCKHLGPEGQTVGLFDGARLVAYAMLGLPGADAPDNLAAVMGWPAEARARSAHLASVMVAPDYRGRSLHGWLIDARIAQARALGRRHLFSMVALTNDASWTNLCRHRMFIRVIAPLEGARLRYLTLRTLGEAVDFAEPMTSVDPYDIPGQQRLLGEGYWGIRRTIRSARCRVVYARPRFADGRPGCGDDGSADPGAGDA